MIKINVCGWRITAQVNRPERRAFEEMVRKIIEKNFSYDAAFVTFSKSVLITSVPFDDSTSYALFALVEIGGESEKECEKFAKLLDRAMQQSTNKKMHCCAIATYKMKGVPLPSSK